LVAIIVVIEKTSPARLDIDEVLGHVIPNGDFVSYSGLFGDVGEGCKLALPIPSAEPGIAG